MFLTISAIFSSSSWGSMSTVFGDGGLSTGLLGTAGGGRRGWDELFSSTSGDELSELVSSRSSQNAGFN